jgi:hypothetical protein
MADRTDVPTSPCEIEVGMLLKQSQRQRESLWSASLVSIQDGQHWGPAMGHGQVSCHGWSAFAALIASGGQQLNLALGQLVGQDLQQRFALLNHSNEFPVDSLTSPQQAGYSACQTPATG